MDDQDAREQIARISRPHCDGGIVVERAAVMAAGPDSAALLRWIEEHDGTPEALPAPTVDRGLHGPRRTTTGMTTGSDRAPLRYVLPAGALDAREPDPDAGADTGDPAA